MESDTERGVGSFGNDGEELSPMMTITSLNRGMDSIVAKAGTLSALENIKGITSFERKFKRAIDTTPFGCYPSPRRQRLPLPEPPLLHRHPLLHPQAIELRPLR